MRRVLLAVVIMAAGSAVQAEHWEQFRGPNGTGVAERQNLPADLSAAKNLLWKAQVPGAGHSSPVVWDQRVFLQSAAEDGSERLLLCFNAADGSLAWKQALPSKSGKIHALNSLASATPATDGQGVYVSVWDGKTIALAAYTVDGQPMWRKELGAYNSEHGAGASPIVYKDKVIFALDMDRLNEMKQPNPRPATLFALDKKTGATAWEAPREAHRACYALPVLREGQGGRPELVVASTTAITGYNPDNGESLWAWSWKFAKKPLRTIGTTQLADGLLVSTSGDGGGDRHAVALEVKGKEVVQLWENRKDLPYVPTMLTRGDHLYFVNDGGFAGCVEARTGKKVWYERIPDAKFFASPVLVDGKIYAPSEQGDVVELAAEPNFRLIATHRVGERIRATPAVADGRLYVRGQHHLFCFGQPR